MHSTSYMNPCSYAAVRQAYQIYKEFRWRNEIQWDFRVKILPWETDISVTCKKLAIIALVNYHICEWTLILRDTWVGSMYPMEHILLWHSFMYFLIYFFTVRQRQQKVFLSCALHATCTYLWLEYKHDVQSWDSWPDHFWGHVPST